MRNLAAFLLLLAYAVPSNAARSDRYRDLVKWDSKKSGGKGDDDYWMSMGMSMEMSMPGKGKGSKGSKKSKSSSDSKSSKKGSSGKGKGDGKGSKGSKKSSSADAPTPSSVDERKCDRRFDVFDWLTVWGDSPIVCFVPFQPPIALRLPTSHPLVHLHSLRLQTLSKKSIFLDMESLTL